MVDLELGTDHHEGRYVIAETDGCRLIVFVLPLASAPVFIVVCGGLLFLLGGLTA